MKKVIILVYILCAGVWTIHAQVRIVNSANQTGLTNSPAFIDASSNPAVNNSENVGKGLIFPRVDLSALTAFPSVSAGLPTSFPSRFDGMIVYNISTSGTAGVGSTEGTLSPGFWYYENKSSTNDGGTWKPLGSNSADADGIVGNEVTDATSGGGLVRAGSGTAADPYTLGIVDAGVTAARIAGNAVTSAKIADGAVTYDKIDKASASSGQVLKYSGTAWAPAAESLVSAANGLTKSGTNAELGGTLTKATAIAQAGFDLYTTGSGKVSIGATPSANSAKFEVNGAAANTDAYNAGSSRTIDFSRSNLAYTSASAGAFTLNHLKDGGAYTLAVQGTTSATSTFTATSTDGTALAVKILNNMATVPAAQPLYTMIVMQTVVYVFVSSGF